MKSDGQKQVLIEHLRKLPIIQVACEKSGIARATFYRWRKEDPEFSRETQNALDEGTHLINDMAESQLISGIRDKNMSAIMYWLRHHHETYINRMELITRLGEADDLLTPTQQCVIREALRIAAPLDQLLEPLLKPDEKRAFSGNNSS